MFNYLSYSVRRGTREINARSIAHAVTKSLGWDVRSRCVAYTAPGKDFELILTVKMETRHRGGTIGSEFPAICNHCGVITA